MVGRLLKNKRTNKDTRQNKTIAQQLTDIQSVEFSFPFRYVFCLWWCGRIVWRRIINDSTLYVAEFFRHPSFSLLFFLGYGFSPFTWISPLSSLVPVQLQLLRPLRWSHILVVIQTNSPLFTWPRPCWWESLPMSFVLPMVVCALVGPLHGVVFLFLSFSSSIKFIYLIFFLLLLLFG